MAVGRLADAALLVGDGDDVCHESVTSIANHLSNDTRAALSEGADATPLRKMRP